MRLLLTLVLACGSGASATYEEADVAALHAVVAEATLIDVRTPQEFAEGRVPGAKNIPLDELPGRIQEIPNQGPVYLICRSGGRSARASELLLQQGYTPVNVLGGTLAWQAAGHPLETPSPEGR